jgi:hypothetical protein
MSSTQIYFDFTIRGNTGETGPTITGPQGSIGVIGAEGPSVQGPQGPAGPIGPIGFTGPEGVGGRVGTGGATGAQGLQGAGGVGGAQGPAGSIGNAGAQGPQGPRGSGSTGGATGPAGPTGPNGGAGLQGATGPSGNVFSELRTIFVDPNGNDGISKSEFYRPFRTLGQAFSYYNSNIQTGQDWTIYVFPGTYLTETINIDGSGSPSELTIKMIGFCSIYSDVIDQYVFTVRDTMLRIEGDVCPLLGINSWNGYYTAEISGERIFSIGENSGLQLKNVKLKSAGANDSVNIRNNILVNNSSGFTGPTLDIDNCHLSASMGCNISYVGLGSTSSTLSTTNMPRVVIKDTLLEAGYLDGAIPAPVAPAQNKSVANILIGYIGTGYTGGNAGPELQINWGRSRYGGKWLITDSLFNYSSYGRVLVSNPGYALPAIPVSCIMTRSTSDGQNFVYSSESTHFHLSNNYFYTNTSSNLKIDSQFYNTWPYPTFVQDSAFSTGNDDSTVFVDVSSNCATNALPFTEGPSGSPFSNNLWVEAAAGLYGATASRILESIDGTGLGPIPLINIGAWG